MFLRRVMAWEKENDDLLEGGEFVEGKSIRGWFFRMRGSNNSDGVPNPGLRPDSAVIEGDADFMKNGYGDHGVWGPDFYLNVGLISSFSKLLENDP